MLAQRAQRRRTSTTATKYEDEEGVTTVSRSVTVWRQIVDADRLWAKGDGWWRIKFACGHEYAVLHGPTSPIGERATCYWCGRHEADTPPPQEQPE